MRQPAFLLVLLLTAATVNQATAQQQVSEALVPSVTVTGTGEVEVRPDMATVSVGVITEAETAAAAVKENNARMEELFQVLKEQGIAEKDIQTTHFQVGPKYNYDASGKEPPRIVGYTVNNQVEVKVRQLDEIGTVLDAVVQKGANRIQGITFSLKDPAAARGDAQSEAMRDARRRAEIYAAHTGAKVGNVLLIREQQASVPEPMMFARAGMEAAQAVPVAPGEQTVSATVSVTYKLEFEE